MVGSKIGIAIALCGMVACGGDNATSPDAQQPPADADTRDIADRLASLPGVTVTEKSPVFAAKGDRYFVLQITQPVDHGDPGGATFQQEVSLVHHDVTAPMVLLTTGYDDFNGDFPSEPQQLLSANQISVEYRYFGTSRPDPADWSKLTIEQMADDEHAIVELLKPIYGAAWISSGGSKGGMTATYHSRFFPDDVAGTLAYVAPLSLSIPDPRYATFLAADGTQPCADNVRAAAKDMLQNRRAALLAKAQAQATAQQLHYTRVGIPQSLESAIEDLEWSFWQYAGVGSCGLVPDPATATDDQMFVFLDRFSPVSFTTDEEDVEFEAYFYQARAQLGSPGTEHVRGDLVADDIAALSQFTDADYTGVLPLGEPLPTFDPSAMADIKTWIASPDAAHFAFVYGEMDPWSGGRYDLGQASDAISVTTPQGTHDDGVFALSDTDRAAVFAKLEAWTGVTPLVGALPAKRAARTRRHGL